MAGMGQLLSNNSSRYFVKGLWLMQNDPPARCLNPRSNPFTLRERDIVFVVKYDHSGNHNGGLKAAMLIPCYLSSAMCMKNHSRRSYVHLTFISFFLYLPSVFLFVPFFLSFSPFLIHSFFSSSLIHFFIMSFFLSIILIRSFTRSFIYTVCLKKNYTLLKWRPNKKYSILGGKDYMYG